jgi:hypothetical protein
MLRDFISIEWLHYITISTKVTEYHAHDAANGLALKCRAAIYIFFRKNGLLVKSKSVSLTRVDLSNNDFKSEPLQMIQI